MVARRSPSTPAPSSVLPVPFPPHMLPTSRASPNANTRAPLSGQHIRSCAQSALDIRDVEIPLESVSSVVNTNYFASLSSELDNLSFDLHKITPKPHFLFFAQMDASDFDMCYREFQNLGRFVHSLLVFEETLPCPQLLLLTPSPAHTHVRYVSHVPPSSSLPSWALSVLSTNDLAHTFLSSGSFIRTRQCSILEQVAHGR